VNGLSSKVEQVLNYPSQNSSPVLQWIHSKYNWLLTAEDSHKENIKFSLQKPSKPVVNPDIQKENAKVVDAFDVEDISEKAVFCRCWRSKKVRCLVCAPFIFWPNCQFPWIVMGRSCCQISQWYIQSRFIIMCTSIIWPEYILCVFLFLFSPFENSFQNEDQTLYSYKRINGIIVLVLSN
jgi:hypothetical protein